MTISSILRLGGIREQLLAVVSALPAHRWKLSQCHSSSFSSGSRITIQLRIVLFFIGPVCKLCLNLFHISHIVSELWYFKEILIKWFCFTPDHAYYIPFSPPPCNPLHSKQSHKSTITALPKWLILYLYILVVHYGSLLFCFGALVYIFSIYYSFILNLDHFLFYIAPCFTHVLVTSTAMPVT